MQVQEQKSPTKTKNSSNRLRGWLVPKSPVKAASTTNGGSTQQTRNGEHDVPVTIESPSSSSASITSLGSKANGMPSWEHPKKDGGTSRMPTIDLNNLPPKSPRRQISQTMVPMSPAVRTSSAGKRTSPRPHIEPHHRMHPNFENMIITVKREDSVKSLGELTFDGSVAYDMGYQKHQERLQRQKQKKSRQVVRTPGEPCTPPPRRNKLTEETIKMRKSSSSKKKSTSDIVLPGLDDDASKASSGRVHGSAFAGPAREKVKKKRIEATASDSQDQAENHRSRQVVRKPGEPCTPPPRRNKMTEEMSKMRKSSSSKKKSTSDIAPPALDDDASKSSIGSVRGPDFAGPAREKLEKKRIKATASDSQDQADKHRLMTKPPERARVRGTSRIICVDSPCSSAKHCTVDFGASEKSLNVIELESPHRKPKKSMKARETEAFEESELSIEPVSLSNLYNNWREQSENASVHSSPCTASSRSTLQMPSPPTPSASTSHIRFDANDSTNNTGTSFSATQDDTSYIFGSEVAARCTKNLEREQEEAMFNLAVLRSLEDSSHSSMTGFSSQMSQGSGTASSCDTGQHVVRNGLSYQPQLIRANRSQQGRPALTGAGCHLAMIAGAGNMKSMLECLDDDSEEEDLPYTAPSQARGEVAFIWKRDQQTNRWYKKPVFTNTTSALSDDDTLFEEAMQRSIRDALQSSFAELQDTAATQFGACRHW